MSGTSPFAYLRWHARDSLLRSVVPLLLFTAIAVLPIRSLVSRFGMDAIREGGQLQQNVLQIYSQTLTLAMTLGAVLLLSGFVAQDRERGHVRFLFAAPVVPWQHYLMRALVAVLMFTALFVLIPIGFSRLVVPVEIVGVLKSALLFAALYGGLAMLAGALANKDGVLFILLVVATTILQQLDKGELLSQPLAGLARALPPLVLADGVRSRWLAGFEPASADLIHVGLYAVALYVVALVVIRRAPLAR
jgi:hypothetical protein